MERKLNSWNIWQHFRKQAGSKHRADVWAFNYIRVMMPKDKLEQYERNQ